jgi:PAS domain S-box-containing protein
MHMDEVLEVLARTADGVYAVDQNQRIVFWNTAAEHILGYQAAEVIGRSCHEIFRGVPRPGCVQCDSNCPVLEAVSAREQIATYNLLSRTKAGETVLLNVSVIVPPQGRTYVSIHMFRDTTHQLRYETYVEQLLCGAARLPAPQTTLAQRPSNLYAVYAPLSAREKEVLHLLVQGQSTRDIACSLCISYATVRNHIQTILRKLGVHSQREAMKVAMEHHLV